MKKYFQTRLAFLGGGRGSLAYERSRSAPKSAFFAGPKVGSGEFLNN